MVEPHLNLFLSALSLKNKCSAFTMVSKQKEGEKRQRVYLSIDEKHEIIKKLELEVSVVRDCDEYGEINKKLATFGGLKMNSQVM